MTQEHNASDASKDNSFMLIFSIYGESGGIRIPDLRSRNPLLYPAELHSRYVILMKLVLQVGYDPTTSHL